MSSRRTTWHATTGLSRPPSRTTSTCTSAILKLIRKGNLSPGEVFTLVHLDSVVLERSHADDRASSTCASLCLAHGTRSSSRSASWSSIGSTRRQRRMVVVAKQHRRLASLFEQADGFRVVPGFDADSLGLDVAFAFPTSDPGWHLADRQRSVRSLGRQLARQPAWLWGSASTFSGTQVIALPYGHRHLERQLRSQVPPLASLEAPARTSRESRD